MMKSRRRRKPHDDASNSTKQQEWRRQKNKNKKNKHHTKERRRTSPPSTTTATSTGTLTTSHKQQNPRGGGGGGGGGGGSDDPTPAVVPFPSHYYLEFQKKKNDSGDDFFLRNDDDDNDNQRQQQQQEEENNLFQIALDTSYLGLAIDSYAPPKKKKESSSCPLTCTLQEMHSKEYFQTDVTQPFGLGSKCAKTYVTRCLVGDAGTTYKYLGLRMFAFNWAAENNNNTAAAANVCSPIGQFKDEVLVPNTKHHLQTLYSKRQQKHGSGSSNFYQLERSRSQYNICLINRMDCSPKNQNNSGSDYKLEPTLQQDDTKIAVAWHADSSLEHYSNIAVYQVITSTNDNEDNDNDDDNTTETTETAKEWRLALRTTPNAEGPNISSDPKPDPTIPQLSIKLPSRTTYYMLDDFNHHHQHAVLLVDKKKDMKKNQSQEQQVNHNNNNTTVRYSATYRLLRPSHTAQEIIQQCLGATRNFHKKGIKRVWRTEQLLQNTLESEWLRQFYIQGQHHHAQHWKDWAAFVTEMWKFWSLLEHRTQQVVDLLQNAAIGKCNSTSTTTTTTISTTTITKSERKLRDKQRKALQQVQEILSRNDNNKQDDANTTLYQPMVTLLRERATLRKLWKKREKDHVFTTMEKQHRPIPWPVLYDNQQQSQSQQQDTQTKKKKNNNSDTPTTQQEIMATSPLPEDLNSVAGQLEACGIAYQSGKATDLPKQPTTTTSSSSAAAPAAAVAETAPSQPTAAAAATKPTLISTNAQRKTPMMTAPNKTTATAASVESSVAASNVTVSSKNNNNNLDNNNKKKRKRNKKRNRQQQQQEEPTNNKDDNSKKKKKKRRY